MHSIPPRSIFVLFLLSAVVPHAWGQGPAWFQDRARSVGLDFVHDLDLPTGDDTSMAGAQMLCGGAVGDFNRD
ncbi:MAG TPA: hypothetical protein VGC54_06075, partial [Planctomycetota bacterium]